MGKDSQRQTRGWHKWAEGGALPPGHPGNLLPALGGCHPDNLLPAAPIIRHSIAGTTPSLRLRFCDHCDNMCNTNNDMNIACSTYT